MSKSYFKLKPDYNRILLPMIQLRFTTASHYLHHTDVMSHSNGFGYPSNCTALHVLSMSLRHVALDVVVYLWLEVALVTKATKFLSADAVMCCGYYCWLLVFTFGCLGDVNILTVVQIRISGRLKGLYTQLKSGSLFLTLNVLNVFQKTTIIDEITIEERCTELQVLTLMLHMCKYDSYLVTCN